LDISLTFKRFWFVKVMVGFAERRPTGRGNMPPNPGGDEVAFCGSMLLNLSE
jgi:hypothetical protein